MYVTLRRDFYERLDMRQRDVTAAIQYDATIASVCVVRHTRNVREYGMKSVCQIIHKPWQNRSWNLWDG
jgi:hypothetical protein